MATIAETIDMEKKKVINKFKIRIGLKLSMF